MSSRCLRARVPSPCPRGNGVRIRNVAAKSSSSSIVGAQPNDHISSAKKWQIGLGMQRKLRQAVKEEDYATAAQCRDALNSLQLSPIQMLEMNMSEQLVDGTYDEKAKSLRKLSQLHPTEETQSLIIEAIKDEALTTLAQKVILAIWLRHPHNWKVNELLDEGIKAMEMAVNCKDASSLQPALARFEEAASLDPTHPESWNKIATVLYLNEQYAESIHACEQVLSLNPQHYMALSGKGLCHIYLHEHKEAEICLREALQINPFLTQFRRFLSASENGEL